MKRRQFLKGLAKAVAVITVAPVAIAQATKRTVPYKIYPPQMRDVNPKIAMMYKEHSVLDLADDAYDGSKCNPWALDEVGKTWTPGIYNRKLQIEIDEVIRKL